MKKKQIRHIVHGFYKNLKKRFNQIRPGFDTETIHQYRVEHKKLRAFLRLLSAQTKKGKIKIPGKLKNIYRITGALRDLQLLEQKLSQQYVHVHRPLQTCMDSIRFEMEGLKKQFAQTVRKKIITVAGNKMEHDLPNNCTLTTFRKFAIQNWDEINKLISMHQFRDSQIHTVRKNLKDLYYNLKHFKRSEASILSLGNWNNSSLIYIETLMVELGNFRDNGKAVDLITRHITDYGDAEYQKVLKQVLSAWKLEKKRRRQILVDQLKEAVAA